jgi:hypothetical protein
MRAVVLREELEVGEVLDPVTGPGEFLVRRPATVTCESKLSIPALVLDNPTGPTAAVSDGGRENR